MPTEIEPLPPSRPQRWQHYLQTEGLEDADLPRAEVDSVGTEVPLDSHKIRTHHTFSTSPFTKGGAVILISLLGVSIGGVLLKAFLGGFSGAHTAKLPQATAVSHNAKTELSETDRLRQALLKAQQANEIELAKTRAKAEAEKKAKPARRTHPSPNRYALRPARSVQPLASRPVQPTPTPQFLTQPRKAMSVPPLPPPPVVPIQAAPQPISKDPQQQWLEASQIGSYGSGTATTLTTPDLPTEVKRERPAASIAPLSGVLPGTLFKGKIETPWDSVSGTTFRILVTEALQTGEGQILIPKGAYLIATASGGDFPKVTVKQIVTRSNGQYQAQNLPANALAVQGDNGILKASVTQTSRSNAGSSLFAAGLKGVANAAQLANRATITTTANGSTTLGYDEADYGSAVLAGVTDSLSNQISSKAASASNRGATLKVYRLKPGTAVQIIVNQSF